MEVYVLVAAALVERIRNNRSGDCLTKSKNIIQAHLRIKIENATKARVGGFTTGLYIS